MLSRVWLFAIPWTAARQASLSITNSQSLLKFMSIESVMPSNHLILCHPIVLPPSIFPSIRVFSKELFLCIRWAKYWSFSSNIQNIQDWFPLGLTGWISLQSKGLSESSPQFKNITCLVLTPLYGPTLTTVHDYWKAIALTLWTIVSKVMSLLFNTLYRFVIAFFLRSKRLLISWLQSPSTVIFGVRENKICYCFHYLPIHLPWSNGTGFHDLSFLNADKVSKCYSEFSLRKET